MTNLRVIVPDATGLAEHRRRREELMRGMALEARGNSVALFLSSSHPVRSNDVHHEYRADSDLLYLTGFDEPECAALIAPERDERYTLFVRPRDAERETWDGWRAGPEGGLAFGADRAHAIAELWEKVEEAVKGCDTFFWTFGRDAAADARVAEMLGRLRWGGRLGPGAPRALGDACRIVHEMRLHKSAWELERMTRAAEIACAGHVAAMRQARPGIAEWELEAIVEAEFRRAGASGPSYPSIVASGIGATVLHYNDNRRRAGERDLVLIDAGCEVDGYASDVTRTFPVHGRFEDGQRDLYALVLEAQQAALARVLPGEPYNAAHQAAVGVLARGMLELGLLPGGAARLDEVVEKEEYKRYFMHRTSHWLGLDVHDAGAYMPEGEPRRLAPGMVLTVEPGIYVPVDDEQAPQRYRGIGVRIEDDIAVTAEGSRNLSAGAPTSIAEIEALVGTDSRGSA